LPYEVHDGRVLTWSLEVHLTDHCNLRCVHCCTLSPLLAPRITPTAHLERDLALAARVLRPNLLKLTGGEPLLHPEIVRCAEIARASGVASQVSVTTNGLLLARMPDAFFAAIDRLTLSHYPSAQLSASALAAVVERCHEHGIVLMVKRIERFAQMDPAAPHDAEQALRIYRDCWLKQRCHLLHRGRFYTCTRPPHLEDRLGGRGAGRGLAEEDGVRLEEDPESLAGRLLRYLESEEPLASCRHCLGGSGEWEAHRQRSLSPSSGSPPM
jgi:organic radical activating enzyme